MGRCWGAGRLALAAADAVAGLFGIGEVGFPLVLDGLGLAEHPQLVPDAEVVRDVHPHGAGHTVPAAGAADLDAAVQEGGGLLHRGSLCSGQRLKAGKGGQVIRELILGTHAREDDMDVPVAAHPAQGPGGIRGLGPQGLEGRFGLRGQVGQCAALDGFHDDEGDIQLFGQLIAAVTRDLLGTVIGVQIVILQLAEIPGLIPQDVLKARRVVVAGEAEAADAAQLFLLPQPVHDAHFLGPVVPGGVQECSR